MIIISPYAKKLRNGKPNPKDYPFWRDLLSMIDEPVIQVGIEGEEQLVDDFRKNRHISELCRLLKDCRTWISCDSFFQHLAWDQKKSGIVLWSVSDPLIFGHPENVNLIKNRDNLSKNQFYWWENTEHNSDFFVKPEEIIKYLYPPNP